MSRESTLETKKAKPFEREETKCVAQEKINETRGEAIAVPKPEGSRRRRSGDFITAMGGGGAGGVLLGEGMIKKVKKRRRESKRSL